MKKLLAERSQKTQSFQWGVGAVWPTFKRPKIEIIDRDYDARFTRPAGILPIRLADCARFVFP
jgi:hypothetical protein